MTEQMTEREKQIRGRLAADFLYYAPRALAILPKPDENGRRVLKKFEMNAAQLYIHGRLEEQKARVGLVRALILKGRQQGASTLIGARFYHQTSNNFGQRTFILTHSDQATQNLFEMTKRYHENCPASIRPYTANSNAKELVFSKLDSRYQVSTAGSKGAGRSATLTKVHGSEVAFWEKGEVHLAGLMQAVAYARGTEVILESTANGVGNFFHEEWVKAEKGEGDFIAIFVPWFWQNEYRRPAPEGFELRSNIESVPDGELTEYEYAKAYKLDNDQMFWRRMKIIELGTGDEGFYMFKQEYPATAEEAFLTSSGQSFMPRNAVVRARKSNVATKGALIIGVDPAGDGEKADRFIIIRRMTRRLFNPERLVKLSTTQAARRLLAIIKNERPAKMFIDVGGLGKGVFDALMDYPQTQGIVEPVNFGENAFDSETYVNRKAEMAWEFKEWIQDTGGANIPDDDEFQADILASVPDEPDRLQRKRLKSKQWMRSKGIRSPDYFDAACLTFAAPVGGRAIAGTFNSSVNFDPFEGSLNQQQQFGASVDFDPLDF